jgi:hypothetical protein
VETKDWLTVLAIILSPLIAIQVEKYLNRRREREQRKVDVFRTLMATRAAGLSPAHVDALNRIDIEFHEEKEVKEAWKAYLDHLNTQSQDDEAWGAKRQDLLAELLHAMSRPLKYDFDRTHIKRATYYPRGYGDYEQDHLSIRKGIVEVLAGRKPLPMSIESLPGTPEDFQEVAELRKLMIRSYKGELPLEVKVIKEDEPLSVLAPLAPRQEGRG